ncbi:uncharacterized protein LOC129212698 [Grus americana]|uniref:uncharacterized protein LOC129212698 n=1 Tax=Grus americana TaxID=9117 RepID=UPI0024083925|nr:uncharacterized protein LOC129212698 [Grus americana]
MTHGVQAAAASLGHCVQLPPPWGGWKMCEQRGSARSGGCGGRMAGDPVTRCRFGFGNHSPGMAGCFTPSNFHLLILVPVTPGTSAPRGSHVVNVSMSQQNEFPQFSTAAEKPSGIPSSLSETTGCCQYVPVAIPGGYTETEMNSAVMTKAVHEEPSSLPFTVKSAGLKACRRVAVALEPSRSLAPVGWGMKRSVRSACPGTRTSAALHPWQGNTH